MSNAPHALQNASPRATLNATPNATPVPNTGAQGSGPPPVDVLIVGAGPAGLCLALRLLPLGLRVVLVEQAPHAALANPDFDGREIALTHHSAALLREMGVWQHLPPEAISPLRDARVLNGPNPFAMTIAHTDAPPLTTGEAPEQLGFLVGNHHIRRAAFLALQAAGLKVHESKLPLPLDAHGLFAMNGEMALDGAGAGAGADADADASAGAGAGPDSSARTGAVALVAGQAVQAVATTDAGAQVTLVGGQVLRAQLLVAADSRHSSTRRALGLAADLHDFGRSMLVCAMHHEQPHHHAAWQWFDHGQTLALLPMNPCPATGKHRSSVVLTLPNSEVQAVAQLGEAAFNAELQRRFAHRLGTMALASTRHVYPLVAVYPRRLVGLRLACVGDAACGMHPITAHGFNLGLKSVEALAAELRRAQRLHRPLADATVLARYERTHWLASRPTYLATQLIASLYTRETPPARLLRHAALRVGQRLGPFRRAVAASLTGA